MVHQGLRRRTALALAALPWMGSCSWPRPGDGLPPPLPCEFRAAWVATVAHIDWPSRAGLTSAQQRAEMLHLLDRAATIGLNALVLQVRPAADAIYPSDLEPWSEYLTGASGRAPDEAWDPLAEWVAGAHRRGLELHAWFNPYRARHASARSEPAATHVANSDAAIVRRYGESLWLDPGEPRAAQRMLDVVLDVLRRYDIDGVHIDDYFYPYPVNDEKGTEQPFPDETAYQRHVDSGGRLDRAAWRRDNVDRLVQTLHREIHATKPWVRFGISPFGLPRPDRRPAGISGFSQYDKLFADVETWLDQGWLDYLAPQLYWPIDSPAQAFGPLLQAWRDGNTRGRHLWPGLFTSRLGAERNAYLAPEVLAQVERTRTSGAADNGHLHFSMAALLGNRDGIADRLREGPYAEQALTPATPWLAEPPPEPPAADVRPGPDGGLALWPRQGSGPPLRQAVLWQHRGGAGWVWQARPLPAVHPFDGDPAGGGWLLGVGRSGGISRPVRMPPGSTHSHGLWPGHELSLAAHPGSA
jgi:uncharacterized lipoprotein YddW (UPF0748 family)